MGMALPPKPKIKRKPWTKGNIICENCDAEYMPGNWVVGYNYYEVSPTSNPKFYGISTVRKNHCPNCNHKND